MSQIDDPLPLCLSCGAELSRDSHFCPKCNAPADAFAVTGPFETIQTRGWGFRVAQQPRNFLVFAGAWLIWGPLLLGACAGLFTLLAMLPELLSQRVQGTSIERFFFLIAMMVCSAGVYVCGTYLFRVSSYYLQHRHDPPPPDDGEADDAEGLDEATDDPPSQEG